MGTRQKVLDTFAAWNLPDNISELPKQVAEHCNVGTPRVNSILAAYASLHQIPLRGTEAFRAAGEFRNYYQRLQRTLRSLPRLERPDRPWMNQLGIPPVSTWSEDHADRLQNSFVIDKAVTVFDFLRSLTGHPAESPGYPEEQVRLRVLDREVEPHDQRLRAAWQTFHRNQEALKVSASPEYEYNGKTLSLLRCSAPIIDRGPLIFECAGYDWHRMVSLNRALGEGNLPESYRDDLFPEETSGGYQFESRLPNAIGVQGIVLTRDNHLILTRRSNSVAWEPGRVSATFEEGVKPGRDASPFDTFRAACLRKTRAHSAGAETGEELRLTLDDASPRLVALIVEPEANGVSCLLVGRCLEDSSAISPHRTLGNDRELRSVWTLPLTCWDQVIARFFEPDFAWHATARLRLLVALCCVHGYDHTMSRIGREVQSRG